MKSETNTFRTGSPICRRANFRSHALFGNDIISPICDREAERRIVGYSGGGVEKVSETEGEREAQGNLTPEAS